VCVREWASENFQTVEITVTLSLPRLYPYLHVTIFTCDVYFRMSPLPTNNALIITGVNTSISGFCYDVFPLEGLLISGVLIRILLYM
jgi:hypothetical protein